MRPLVWRLPSTWTETGLAERAALAPPIQLAATGRVSFAWRGPVDLERDAALVLMADGEIAEADVALVEQHRGRVLVQPVGGLPRRQVDWLADTGVPILAGWGGGELASRFPGPADLLVTLASGAGARAAEDAAAARILLDLGLAPPATVRAAAGGLVVVGDAAGVEPIAPSLDRARRRHGVDLQLFLRDPAAVNLERLGLQGAGLAPDSALSLAGLQSAAAIGCAFAAEPLNAERPALWARSGVLAAVPVTASSHPALDGLAEVCVLDDWDRGLGRALRGELDGQARALRDAQRTAAAMQPSRVALSWRAAIERGLAPRTARRGPGARPELLVLLDLAQDLDLLLPIVSALSERGALSVRPVVTDWLQGESPRIGARLAEAGFSPQVVKRASAAEGEAPALGAAAGVLVAADSNLEAHRVARRLVDRARAQGLATFSLQHGFENVGLTYRDPTAPPVDVGAEEVFTWGPSAALPSWVPPRTRAAARPLGDPKSPPPTAAQAAWPPGPWTLRVAVFENLHWERYDEAWRQRFLASLAAVARAAPHALFLLKPHHAGRWLLKRRTLAPRGPNIRLVDPRHPEWEPFTAPALIAGADRVVTTPSTVAVDAARGGRPVAVCAFGLDLAAYAPLRTLEGAVDLAGFLAAPADELLRRNEAFLSRALLPGAAAHRIAGAIETRLIRAGEGTSRMASVAESVN